jgi:hypothetical protein
MKMKTPRPPHSNDHSSECRPAADFIEPHPYWLPPGVELDDWPPELRAEVISIINPEYRQLVLLAKPGLERSTGITIHLLWLEILDQIEIARQALLADNRPDDPLQLQALVSRPESRKEIIERHSRLVHAKINATVLLLRLEKLKARLQSASELPISPHYSNLSALPRRPHNHGKNDFR